MNEIQTLSKEITFVPKDVCMEYFSRRILKYNKIHLTVALYQTLKKPEQIECALIDNIKGF
jgi:hypothetical protein